MSLMYASVSRVSADIHQLATTFRSPRGKNWHVNSSHDAGRTRYKIRAWNPSTTGDHECWVSFDVMQSERDSQYCVVEATLCSTAHHAGKARSHVMNTLHHRYGRPL